MNFELSWSDYFGNYKELTEKELGWFYGIVEKAKKATGYNVNILPYNHDLFKGKSKDALGCCVTTNPEDCLGAGVDTFITIDTFFIHEKYSEEFENGYSLERDTLEHVIAHELAHLTVWRHGKKHTAKTEELYNIIINYKESEKTEEKQDSDETPDISATSDESIQIAACSRSEKQGENITLEGLRQEGAREYRTEPTGAYTTNRNGRRIPVTKPVEYVTTVTGEKMTLSEWTEKAIEAVRIENKENLLSGIIDYVKSHCAWIHSEKERLIYALDCLTDETYMHWDDFWKSTEGR